MRQVLLYGCLLGLLLVLLQYAQYRLVLIRHAESVYTGFVALICCAMGMWAGLTLNRRLQKERAKEPKEDIMATQAIDSEKVLTEMNISPREYEVLQLIAQGLSNQEIAERLFLSLNTVKTHTSNVFAKLNVQRRTQAIQKAKNLGLL